MIHQTSTLTTSFPQEVPIDPLDSLDAPLDPLGPLNIPLGQVLAPEFLSARCSVSGDMKGGQVGYPWKGLSKLLFNLISSLIVFNFRACGLAPSCCPLHCSSPWFSSSSCPTPHLLNRFWCLYPWTMTPESERLIRNYELLSWIKKEAN